jgi:predicted metal-binding protein
MGEPGRSRAVVLVCITCRSPAGTGEGAAPDERAGRVLAEGTARAAGDSADVSVIKVRCLANCGRGPSAAIRCQDRWTYVFGHLTPDADGPALIAGARLLAQSTDGTMPWKERPEPLKRGLIARIPPADYIGEVGEVT